MGIINCPKCNNKFDNYSKYGPKKFCSRSCANSRIWTKDSNEKRRAKLIKSYYEYHCAECNEIFKSKRKNRKFCTKKCSSENGRRKIILSGVLKTDRFRSEQSNRLKKLYSDGKSINGGFTKWYEYKDIKVQGTYELRTCFILDKLKEQGKIKGWEYTRDRFSYSDENNNEHTYLLDFKVFNDTGFYYIETKGYVRKNDPLKWNAVKRLGFDLKIWFEEDIKQYESMVGIV